MNEMSKLTKKQVNKRLFFSGGLGLILGGGAVFQFLPVFLGTAALELAVVPVELDPAGVSKNLQVKGFKVCKKNDHPGCLTFEKGQEGYIKFYIKNADSGKTCEQGADEVITQVKVTSEELVTNRGNENRSKGDFDAELAPWLKRNAFKFLNEDNGTIYDVGLENGWTQVVIQNLNNNEGLKHFWYQVTVTSCDDPNKTWVTDPRGDNEGRN